MPSSIVVIGSSNTDMIVRVPTIPGAGETLLGGVFSTAAGGKGANQAVSAARAGGTVTFIARVGADAFGDAAVAGFRREKLDLRHLVRDPKTPSGVAMICVSAAGENSIAVAGGANARLSPADVRGGRRSIESAKWVLLQLETPLATVIAAAKLAKRAGVSVLLNPAPAQTLPDSLLADISILTPNESEASTLTGIQVVDEASAAKAADMLLGRGVPVVIITLGALGAWVATAAGSQLVPGFKVNPVDTTAAGDTFNGALAVRLSEGAPLIEAVRFAHAAAAISVTRPGAQPSVPSRSEIKRFLGRHGKSKR